MITFYPAAGLTCIFLFFSAYFSASETALFSIRRERIIFFRQSSKKNHQWVFALLNDGQRTLLLILLGNLLVNITAVGLIHTVIGFFITRNTIVATLLIATGVILVFGEIIPKNIAIRNCEGIAIISAPVLFYLKKMLHPILLFLQKINSFFLTGFSRHLRQPSPYITLDEFRSSLAESTRDGSVSVSEWRILQSVLDGADTPVSRYMTHRSRLAYVSADDTLAQAVAAMTKKNTTVCCVKETTRSEDIIGLLYLVDALKNTGTHPVNDYIVPPVWVPESSEIADLVGDMIREEYSEVCVHDEYGAFVGIYSLKNGLHDILHIIPLACENKAEGTQSRIFDGFTELITMQDWIPPSQVERARAVRTLNGFISLYLGKIPKTGERFAIDGWKFYIIRSKLNYVESVLITKKG